MDSQGVRPAVWRYWVLFWVLLFVGQPLWADVVISGTQTTQGQAANGVALLQIAKPDSTGLSHNQYHRFDVDPSGLILNNSTQPVNTQLGGYVLANPHLSQGSARLILNEVNSTTPSQLRGYVEVAGQKADVIVANPAGIYCNGCGFIQTQKATLAAGLPLWESDGRLKGFQIENGRLAIEGAGLNAKNVDALQLYSRALELNAELHAKKLQITTGAMTVDAVTGEATAQASLSDAPEFAIDSYALGGMYANTIRLIGTEAGVGVRLAAPVAAMSGALEITSQGDVRLARSSATTAIRVQTPQTITLSDAMTSGGDIALQAAALQMPTARVHAEGRLSLALPDFNRAETGGDLAANGELKLQTSGDIVVNGAEWKTPGALTLSTTNGKIQLANRTESGGDVRLEAPLIEVSDTGFLAAQRILSTKAINLNNLGLLYGRDALVLQLEGVLNNGRSDSPSAAWLLSNGAITIQAAEAARLQAVNNWGSRIESWHGDITIAADHVRNINMGWALNQQVLAPQYSYSPNELLWETYYHNGISGLSGMHAFRDARTTTDFTVELGQPATIVAGQDMRLITETIANDRSLISATRHLQIDADQVWNTGTKAIDITQVLRSDRVHFCQNSWGNETCTGFETLVNLPDEYGDSALIPAVIEGGQTAVIRGATVNCATAEQGKQGVDCPSESRSRQASTLAKWDGALNVVPELAMSGQLFRLAAPDLPYRIETDPALNTYQGFMGSGYLLQQLQWAPGMNQRRLGDSYYELMQLREALVAQTGSRFLSADIRDERAQYEYLMANAVAASEALQLSPGIALSRKQIDALQQDMVWLEAQEFAGESVLVPVLYLAKGSPRILASGAVIGGGDLSLEGEYIANSGLFQADQSLHVLAQNDINNRGGQISAGGDLRLSSSGDILNESGQLSGHNVSLEAEGNITHRTWSEQQTFGNAVQGSTFTTLGETARVTATGTQYQHAGDSLSISGAQISGETVQLSANRNIVIDTVQTEQGRHFSGTDSSFSERDIRHVQTQIDAEHTLQLKAGADLIATASTLTAGERALLEAGHNLLLLAAEELSEKEIFAQNKHSLGRSESTRQERSTTQLLGTTVSVGKVTDSELNTAHLSLVAGNDIALYASQATSTGQIDVQAGGNFTLMAGVNTEDTREQRQKDSLATYRQQDQGEHRETAVASALMAGSDLNLNAANTIKITASELAAGKTLRIGDQTIDSITLMNPDSDTYAQRPLNVIVDTLALHNESWNESLKGFKGPFKELVKGLSFVAAMTFPMLAASDKLPTLTIGEHDSRRQRDDTQAGSQLFAHDLSVNAQDKVALIAANVHAQGKAEVSAHDIVIDSVAERQQLAHDAATETIKSLGAKLGKDEVRIAGIELSKDGTQSSSSLTTWKGTTIDAQQLVLKAEHDLDVLGATINIHGDAVLSAGNNLYIGGNEGKVTDIKNETKETTTVSASVRNAYLDAAMSVKALKDAAAATKDAERALSEAELKASRGELDPDDVKYFRINVAAAAANLAQAEIAVAAQFAAVAVAGVSSLGTGFYVSGSAQHEKSTTANTAEQGQWLGSQIKVGGNADLSAGEKIKVQGSDIIVANTLKVDAKKIVLVAGEEHDASTSKTTQESAGIGMSSQGSGSVNIGSRQGDMEGQAVRYINSHLIAGTLTSQSDSLQLAGAMIEADDIDIRTKKLSVVSLQDSSQSKSNSAGGNIGLSGGVSGVTGASVAADFQNSSAERRWVTEQAGIIGHDSISIKADDSLITAGIIANATRDENGKLIDQGNLQFKTKKLVVNDLYDVDKTKTIGANLAFGFNIGRGSSAQGTQTNAPAGNTSTGAADTARKGGTPLNSITAGGLYTGHVTERTTFATLGMGQVEVGGELLTTESHPHINRDVSNAQVITKDQDIGGLNASMTVDGRWFSEEGREEMLQQQKGLGTNMQVVMRGMGGEIDRGVNIGTHIIGVENPAAAAEKVVAWIGAGGFIPTALNNGGVLAQFSGQFLSRHDANQRQMVGASADSAYVLAHPEMGWAPITEMQGYHLMLSVKQDQMKNIVVSTNPVAIALGTATYQNATNGMLNTPALAMYNAVTQTHNLISDPSQTILVTLNYNPTRGIVADGIESLQDKLAIKLKLRSLTTAVAKSTGVFSNSVMLARGSDGANFANHSQGNLLNFAGLMSIDLSRHIEFGYQEERNFTWNMLGSPVNAIDFSKYLDSKKMALSSSSVNDGDFVGQILGKNFGLFVVNKDNNEFLTVESISSKGDFHYKLKKSVSIEQTKNSEPAGFVSNFRDFFRLFGVGGDSTHANYNCVVNCGAYPKKDLLKN